MALVWSEERKLESWLQVEIAVSEALADAGVVPRDDLERIKTIPAPDAEAVRERERVTDHDVAAFVDVISASAARRAAGSTMASRPPTCSTPRSRCSSASAGRSCAGAASCSGVLVRARARDQATLCSRPHARRATPSRPRSA
jgi:adenylosuccinate lyase